MYTYIYVYIYIYIYVPTYTYIYIYIHLLCHSCRPPGQGTNYYIIFADPQVTLLSIGY